MGKTIDHPPLENMHIPNSGVFLPMISNRQLAGFFYSGLFPWYEPRTHLV
jgi:hypothetical protein